MHVLEDHQDRTWIATTPQVCVVSASKVFCRRCCGGKFERWITSVVRQRKHFGKQSRILTRRKALRQQRVQFIELRLRPCRRARTQPHAPSG